jgi:hypothetical protein
MSGAPRRGGISAAVCGLGPDGGPGCASLVDDRVGCTCREDGYPHSQMRHARPPGRPIGLAPHPTGRVVTALRTRCCMHFAHAPWRGDHRVAIVGHAGHSGTQSGTHHGPIPHGRCRREERSIASDIWSCKIPDRRPALKTSTQQPTRRETRRPDACCAWWSGRHHFTHSYRGVTTPSIPDPVWSCGQIHDT